MDPRWIEKKIEVLIQRKQYDKRFIPFIKHYFVQATNQYQWDTETLDNKILEYAKQLDKIEYYPIGKNTYRIEKQTNSLILDSDYSKPMDEKRMDSYLNIAIDAQSQILRREEEQYDLVLPNIVKITERDLLIEQTEKSSFVLTMISSAFKIEKREIPDLYKKIMEQEKQAARDRNRGESDYYQEARIYIRDIDREIKDLLSEEELPHKIEAYKRIYADCLLNMSNRIYYLEEDKQELEIIKQNYQKMQEQMRIFCEKNNIEYDKIQTIQMDPKRSINITDLKESIENSIGQEKEMPLIEMKKTCYVDKEKLRDEINSVNSQSNEKIQKWEIEQKIGQLIDEKGYPPVFQYTIEEYFRRSAALFQWNREKLEQRIENFATNIDEIEARKQNGDIKAASVSFRLKKLFIEEGGRAKEVADSLFHEYKHITDKRTIRIKDYKAQETETKYEGKGLNEIITEGSSCFLVGEKLYNDKLHTTFQLRGYEELKYAFSSLTAALGMDEFEFLNRSEEGMGKLIEGLEEQYPNRKLKEKVQQFDSLAEMLYLNLDGKNKKERSNYYAEIYGVIQQIKQEREEQEKVAGTWDKDKAEYEEYKISKNTVLAVRKLQLKKSIIEDKIDYKKVKEQTKVDAPKKKRMREVVGQRYQQHVQKRDNIELYRETKEVCKYIRKQKKDLRTKPLALNGVVQKDSSQKPEDDFKKRIQPESGIYNQVPDQIAEKLKNIEAEKRGTHVNEEGRNC